MAEATVRLAKGQHWTAGQFVSHYFEPTASGTPTPVAGRPSPVDVDRSWYMGEGPGRYYHPGMFPVINQVANSRNLAPGTYDLADLANKDSDFKAKVSHYTTAMSSADYPLRALVFGKESARISGQVTVNPDGSKTFKQIEIRPYDTNFDFEHNTGNVPLEIAREFAKRNYDPQNQGASYDIQYRGSGPGRLYDPFTGSQLNAALRKQFVYPQSGPPWLLPSVAGKPELPLVEEYRQYLDRTNGKNPQAPQTPAATFDFSASGNDIGRWLASLAGVDSMNPTQPAPQLADSRRGIVSNQPMPDWPFPPPIFNTL